MGECVHAGLKEDTYLAWVTWKWLYSRGVAKKSHRYGRFYCHLKLSCCWPCGTVFFVPYDNKLEFCSPSFRSPFYQPFQSQDLTLTLSVFRQYSAFWLNFARVCLSFWGQTPLKEEAWGGSADLLVNLWLSEWLVLGWETPKPVVVLSPIHR